MKLLFHNVDVKEGKYKGKTYKNFTLVTDKGVKIPVRPVYKDGYDLLTSSADEEKGDK